jgi:hypothetical protein
MSKALGVMNHKLSIYEKEFMAVMMAVDIFFFDKERFIT